MRDFLSTIVVSLLLLSVSANSESVSQRGKPRPETVKSDPTLNPLLHVDSTSVFDEYVPSIDFEFDGFGINKRANRKNVHGYYCGTAKHERHFYEQDYINTAATRACDELGLASDKKRKYLKPFSATVYNNFQGPFYEYPIRGKHKKRLFGKKRKNKYPNRIVINMQCEIVDVVTNNDGFHYQQCSRGWH